MATRVLLAVGHRLYRQALSEALTRHGLAVVAEASNGREVLTASYSSPLDIVVLELALRELNGVETIRQLRIEQPHLPALAISDESEHLVVMRVLQAGARGFVVAGSGLEELQRAVQVVMEGRMFLSPELEGAIAQSLSDPSILMSVLTPRETEVLQLIAEGKSTKRVAETLSVSAKTVETHRQHIMKKLRLYSVADLTKYAIREGITTLTR